MMKKVEMMDQSLKSYGKGISSSEICKVVDSIFTINLDKIPLLAKEKGETSSIGNECTSREAIDSYLQQCNKEITGVEIRNMINAIFGVNLDGISSLEGARISLYSKGQWILRDERDLFVVSTGAGDVDVKVFPTNYFVEQTGVGELPIELQQLLIDSGYSYDEEIGHYYFLNPTGEAVEDAFKGKTMGAILNVIQQSFSHL